MSNTGPFQYRNTWYALAPPWLTTGDAEKYMYCLELSRDLLCEKMNQAIHFRLPGEGDASQIPYLANDRVLVQGPAESDASFVLRLQNAFPSWGLAGSGRAVLQNLQAYMQGLQPGVPSTYPMITIVGGPNPTFTQWLQLYQGDAIGALPTLTQVATANFNWDGEEREWWRWLILPMSLVATGHSGTTAATTAATGGSFTVPGQNVGGVWVPNTSGTPVNAPFITITGLSGILATDQWITMSGSSNPDNNGTFPIVQVLSGSSVVIANPNGVGSDAGPITWSTANYPYIGPGLPWGTPGLVWGQGELKIPAKDTGANFRGTWGPTLNLSPGAGTPTAWGLNCDPLVIQTIRGLVKTWKSAKAYYRNIIIAFDCGDGTAGNAYSPNSTQGHGNPDGTFGSVGQMGTGFIAGIWIPSRITGLSLWDAYCQGTGAYQACSVENVT
jgi:hypothetical protein